MSNLISVFFMRCVSAIATNSRVVIMAHRRGQQHGEGITRDVCMSCRAVGLWDTAQRIAVRMGAVR